MTATENNNVNLTSAQVSPPRAYSYLRFSTPEQLKGDSIRRQTTMAEEWCRRNGVELDTELTFRDLGVSAFRGKNVEAGELRAFRDAVEEGVIAQGSYLLLENLDRLTRMPPLRAVNLLADIAREGVRVVTLTDGKVYDQDAFDGTNNMDILIAFIVAMRANEESRLKASRLKAAWAGKRGRAETGLKLTAMCPGWLRLSADRSAFEVIEERAEVVRRIFELALAGHGHTYIATVLNSDGVETFGKADHWNRSFIQKVLRSASVVGTYTPHTTDHVDGKRVRKSLVPVEGYYPPVIDRDIFDTVQAMLASASAEHTVRAPKGGSSFTGPLRNILASLARCPICGGTIRRINKGGRNKAKLICAKAHVAGGCQYRTVDYETVEAALISNAAWLREHAPSKDEQLDHDLAKARSRLEVIEEMIGNSVEAIVSMGSSDALSTKLRALEAEQVETKANVAQLEERVAGAEGVVLAKRLDALEDALTGGDLGKANAALRALVEGVVVDYRTGDLRLKWKHDGETRITFAMPREEGEE